MIHFIKIIDVFCEELKFFRSLIRCVSEHYLVTRVTLTIPNNLKSVQFTFAVNFQVVSCFISLCALALAVTSWERVLRKENQKANSIGSSILFFIWRFLIIASRVIAMAFFGAAYKGWLFCFMGGHILLMFIWLQILDRKQLSCYNCSLNLLYGFVYLMYFCNLGHEALTMREYLIYYGVTLVENLTLVLVPWFLVESNGATGGNDNRQFYKHVLIFVPSAYALGIVLQTLYYSYLHPNRIKKTCACCYQIGK